MFFNKFINKPKLIKCNRTISIAGRGTLIPVGECFVQLQIGKKTFRDRILIIKTLMRNYILGKVLYGINRFGKVYSTSGRHYITLNGETLAQSTSQVTVMPVVKTKGKIILPPSSISVLEIRVPEISDTNNLYKLGLDTFHLPEGIIPLDILYQTDNKTHMKFEDPSIKQQ